VRGDPDVAGLFLRLQPPHRGAIVEPMIGANRARAADAFLQPADGDVAAQQSNGDERRRRRDNARCGTARRRCGTA
jgi:hypothetical protein